MILFFESLILLVLIGIPCGISTLLIGRNRKLALFTIALLILGPVVDGIIAFLILRWLTIDGLTLWAGALSFALISHVLIQPLLVPQRLVVWRLAKENVLRRKRQAALLLAGLVIASAIITSSLVVGDSLDATVRYEIEASWGETDVTLSGFDMSTGERVTFSENVANNLWDEIQLDDSLRVDVKGQQQGIISGASIKSPSGKSLPTVTWASMNSSIDSQAVWPNLGSSANGIRYIDIEEQNTISDQTQIVVNEVLSNELDLSVGDTVELGWYVSTDEGRKRVEGNATIFEVVENEGMANLAGTKSPAMFTDLSTAQELQRFDSKLNTVYYALSGDVDDEETIEPVIEQLGIFLNQTLTAEDVGFSLDYEDQSSSLSLSTNKGLGRLQGEDVVALRENLSSIIPNSSLMEVLQIPLIEIDYNNEQLLTLSSSTVTDIKQGKSALWHVSDSGFGFQIGGNGSSWLWQVDGLDRTYDFTLNSEGDKGAVAYSSGIVIASEDDSNEEYWAKQETSGIIHSISAVENTWWAVELDEDELYLHQYNEDLSADNKAKLSLNLPSTVRSIDLQFDEVIYLQVEGLLSVDRYVSDSIALDANFSVWVEDQYWPESNQQPSNQSLHFECNSVAVLLDSFGGNWCSYDEGLLRWQGSEIESIRLPILSSAGGFGELPQLLLAFEGAQSPVNVSGNSISISQRLATLGLAENKGELWVKGLIPYAFGNDSALRLNTSGIYGQEEGLESLSDLDSVVLGFISLQYAEQLSAAGIDERSIVIIGGGQLQSQDMGERDDAINSLSKWLDDRSDSDDLGASFTAVKVEASKAAAQSSGVIAGMFLVFGTFTIAAGVLLVLTIILMLAEARRSEMGVLRAIGISRSDARALAIQEGVIVASIAGVLGSILGLLLAWVISVAFDNIFAAAGSDLFTFAWEWSSVFAGWAWGFLIAIITLWCSALWTSKLNIVSALKGGMIRVQSTIPWLLLLCQISTFGGSAIFFLILLVLGFDSGIAYLLWTVGGVLLILTLVPLFTWELPVVFKDKSAKWQKRARHSSRNTLAWTGGLILVWTIALEPFDPVRNNMTPDEISFILLGLFEVFAGVLLLTSAAPILVSRIGRSQFFTKRWGPVLPVALAHPLATPVRTAVVMGMFSITVFSVIVLGGYTEQFDNYSSSFVEDTEGEFELMLTASRSRPLELSSDPLEWNLSTPLEQDIDAVGKVYRSEVFLQDSNDERMPYILRGFDKNFASHGGLPLHLWDESLGDTAEEVWISIGNRDDIVLVDASFGLELSTDGTGISVMSFSIGDSISLIDLSNPGNSRNVIVGGFLKQSSYLFSPGVWINSDVAEEQFDARLTRMYVSLSDDVQPSYNFDSSQVQTLSATGKTAELRIASAELAEHLEEKLNDEGATVSVISDDVILIQSLVIAILGIFEGYLALGLIVGIAGIGVVTVRSVSERRKTIGILRALGYRRKMVTASFLIEVSWVGVLGILNGVLVALGFHYSLYRAFWEDQGADFTLPWLSIVTILVGGWCLILLATLLPIRSASKVPPSAALRDI